jgi:hypothetical protein
MGTVLLLPFFLLKGVLEEAEEPSPCFSPASVFSNGEISKGSIRLPSLLPLLDKAKGVSRLIDDKSLIEMAEYQIEMMKGEIRV